MQSVYLAGVWNKLQAYRSNGRTMFRCIAWHIDTLLDDIDIKDCLIYQGYSVHVRKVCEFIAKYIKSVSTFNILRYLDNS